MSSFLSWLALYRGEVIATSGLTLTQKPPYFSNPSGTIDLLSSMYTVPAFRRRGVACALLSRIIDSAKARGCGVIQITASDTGILLYTDHSFMSNHNFMQLVL